MEVDENFTYLGVDFTLSGRTPITLGDLAEKLEVLGSFAPLKPQQMLFFLNRFTLPSVYHRFTFAQLSAGIFNKMDICIINFVRKILHLPKDVPQEKNFMRPLMIGGSVFPAFAG